MMNVSYSLQSTTLEGTVAPEQRVLTLYQP